MTAPRAISLTSIDLFDDGEAWRESDMEAYHQKAGAQLGTVGSGNHYVDLMRDEAGFIWIGVHFGSRGLGHTSATRYLKAAGGKDGMNVPPAVIDEDSELGRRYIAAMELAGRYSYAGREWVVERVRKIIGGSGKCRRGLQQRAPRHPSSAPSAAARGHQ
jgi:tRNA-splicing ligase RtcB (3'-phosphate/5'-hydroxy nucleic acid ligase)